MVRAPCCERQGLKRGPWTPEEDQILISHVQKHGHGNWRALPKQAGLLRCGKSCRLRWINYLRPDIKRGNFTQQEEETIIQLHQMLGNRWSEIAARLPGRTDNEIKNVWHTNIKKKLKDYELPQTSKGQSSAMPKGHSKGPNLSPERSSSELSSVTNSSAECFPQIKESFLSEHCSSERPSPGIESIAMTCSTNDPLIIKQEEMESIKFIRGDEYAAQEQVLPSDEFSMQPRVEGVIAEPKFERPSSTMDCGKALSAKVEEDMDFWFNVFIRADNLPDLPDF